MITKQQASCSSLVIIILGSWRQYYKSESALHAAGNVADFSADNNNSVSFEFKTKITGKTESNDIKMWLYLVTL